MRVFVFSRDFHKIEGQKSCQIIFDCCANEVEHLHKMVAIVNSALVEYGNRNAIPIIIIIIIITSMHKYCINKLGNEYSMNMSVYCGSGIRHLVNSALVMDVLMYSG